MAARGGSRTRDAWVSWLILGVSLALLWSFVLRSGPEAGGFGDDGVYLATGKALAEGRGYRHIELPGEPLQTKYPPLYPLALAALWRLQPKLLDHPELIRGFNLLCWSLGSVLACHVMARTWRLPRWLIASGVALATLSPLTRSLVGGAMSESLFLCLTMAALALGVTPRRRALGKPLAAALCAATAFLTRTVGISAAVAVLATLIARRRIRAALVAGAVVGIALVGWAAWTRHARTLNAALPASTALAYDLDYSIWLPRDVGTAARVVLHNTADATLSLSELLVPLPPAWLEPNQTGLAGGWPLAVIVVLVLAFTKWGAITTWRRRQPLLHVYLWISIVLILIWPYESLRFLVPLLPILATLLLAGIGDVARRVFGRKRPLAATPVIALVVMVGGWRALSMVTPDVWRERAVAVTREVDALADLIRRTTPESAVIAAPRGGYLYLRTGRKFVPPMPYDQPITDYYPPNRRVLQCGRATTAAIRAAEAQLAERRYGEYLAMAGVTHVVPLSEQARYGSVFEQHRAHASLTALPMGSTRAYRLFEIHRP